MNTTEQIQELPALNPIELLRVALEIEMGQIAQLEAVLPTLGTSLVALAVSRDITRRQEAFLAACNAAFAADSAVQAACQMDQMRTEIEDAERE
jgi:hypothetical protein